MRKLPQRLVNIRAHSREALTTAMGSAQVEQAIGAAGDALSGRGRVLVRASGTEPLIRVMVEAPTSEETDRLCRAAVERRRAGACGISRRGGTQFGRRVCALG